jgi:hypothetical protein
LKPTSASSHGSVSVRRSTTTDVLIDVSRLFPVALPEGICASFSSQWPSSCTRQRLESEPKRHSDTAASHGPSTVGLYPPSLVHVVLELAGILGARSGHRAQVRALLRPVSVAIHQPPAQQAAYRYDGYSYQRDCCASSGRTQDDWCGFHLAANSTTIALHPGHAQLCLQDKKVDVRRCCLCPVSQVSVSVREHTSVGMCCDCPYSRRVSRRWVRAHLGKSLKENI